MVVDKMFLVGLCPAWLKDVIHIPYSDIQNLRQKEKNICGKVLKACNDPRVSDPFIFANDDHFILNPWKGLYEHCGPLMTKQKTAYKQTAQNTIDVLGPCNNFDVHCPIIFDKERFSSAFADMDFPDFGYCMKTIYCVKNGIEGVETTDVKIESALNKVQLDELLIDRDWFSCGDIAWDGALHKWLNNRFRIKCRWEK